MTNMLKVNYKEIRAMQVDVIYVTNGITLAMLHKVVSETEICDIFQLIHTRMMN